MWVELRLFALARERVGRPVVLLELADTASVADLKRALAGAFPEILPLLPHLKFAVDADYADDDTPIPPGADLAAIPPVSGG
ncbi:MAG: MoaD/ThiS family protein [Isosphaeraceae bacterium]